MLKDEVKWPPHRQFESHTEWEPISFFSECLCNSTRFDLKLGFFSSSAIQALSDGFALFLYNGGTMRLIINNILSTKDKNIIIAGTNNCPTTMIDLSNLSLLKDTLSKNDRHFFDCIAWLISQKRIEIKIISPKDTEGIAHTKEGVFYDDRNTISFNGSCNFSRTALLENKESIDVNCDWDGEISEAKLLNTISKFEKTFSGEDESVEYIDPIEIITSIFHHFSGKNLEDLIEIEKELLGKRKTTPTRETIIKALHKAKKQVEDSLEKINSKASIPKFPYPEGPRDYQQTAFENWKNNDQQGLFAMATGTGKTITSLNCLLNLYTEDGGYRAVILVPTIALVDQWRKECELFNYSNIILVSSQTRWKEHIAPIRTSMLLGDTPSFIIISTYASFNLQKFQDEFRHLPSDTLLIADEAHNMGAPSLLKKLKSLHLLRRIGLSATPEKQYDDEANRKIKAFFNEEGKENYTFEYSMEEAIRQEPKALCHYRYYPKLVRLTELEFEEYIALTKKIARLQEPRDKEQQKLFEILCLKRQTIIHKAQNKLSVFQEILRQELSERGNLKYTLVYTPEGVVPNFDASVSDEINEEEEGIKLINEYTKAISALGNKITVRKFVGASHGEERVQMLKDFASGDLQVLTSMKCLDEGVDVPRAELAIFCSSTGNPRQFIQRRGRVLRRHPAKEIKGACIYDLVVIPEISEDLDLKHIERNEIIKELKRVKAFADLSDNPYDAERTLKPILDYYELSI